MIGNKRVKRQFRKYKRSKSGGKNKQRRLNFAVSAYLELATSLTKKVGEFKATFQGYSVSEMSLLASLDYFHQMLDKHMDLVARRLINGEQIPHCEKVFSLFQRTHQSRTHSTPQIHTNDNVADCFTKRH